MSENKIEVTRCKDCIYFIGSDISNVGHCSMWNKGVVNTGFCYRAETEAAADDQCICCVVTIPEGRQVCPQCERRYT
jgi:hypothetical protein